MKRGGFVISGARVSHTEARLDQLEAASYAESGDRTRQLLDREGVNEAFVLQTCNRVEEYVVTDDVASGRDALADAGRTLPDEAVVFMDHQESLRHLLRVASGLESQVLGEDQILGQIRSAFTDAQEHDAIGPVLEAGLLKAIHVGERARSETAINEGTVSLGSAAVDLARRELGLAESCVLVVGAGEMTETVVSALSTTEIGELRFVNRSPARLKRLAAKCSVPVQCDGLGELEHHLREADVVISSTGSREPVIESATVEAAGSTLIVDLAQPRDVARSVAQQPALRVFDLDDLKAVTDRTHEERREAATAVEAIVDEEFDLLLEDFKRRRADDVIAAMYRGADRIKRRELQTALAKLGRNDALSEEGREVVEDLADALVSQLLAVPTKSLRDAAVDDDWETITTAIQLFEPTIDDPAEFFETVTEEESVADESSPGRDG